MPQFLAEPAAAEAVLIASALRRTTITYTDLRIALGLRPGHERLMGPILNEVANRSRETGRYAKNGIILPMLVVGASDNMPGEGMWDYLAAERIEVRSRYEFVIKEQAKIFRAFRRNDVARRSQAA
jgi:hypothetical protein